MFNAGIYIIKNAVDGKFYVGQTTRFSKRVSEHLGNLRKNVHDNPHLQRAWNKYGEQSFTFKLVLICEKSELTYYEQSLVDRLLPAYNIRRVCVDSNRGIKYSEEFGNKISEATRGAKHHYYGKHFSEEHKRRISEGRKNQPSNRLGKKCSEESKRKMSEAQTIRYTEAMSGAEPTELLKPLAFEYLAELSRKGLAELIESIGADGRPVLIAIIPNAKIMDGKIVEIGNEDSDNKKRHV